MVGVAVTPGIDWIEVVLQVAIAAVGVAIAAAPTAGAASASSTGDPQPLGGRMRRRVVAARTLPDPLFGRSGFARLWVNAGGRVVKSGGNLGRTGAVVLGLHSDIGR